MKNKWCLFWFCMALFLGVAHATTYYVNSNNLFPASPYDSTVVKNRHYLSSKTLTNDNFSGAFEISGNSGSYSGSNVGATKERGEPFHAIDSGGKSVWWKWTAPSSGFFYWDTFGSNFDTLLSIYTGTAVDNLTKIISNDDTDTHTQSRVVFQATAGITYYIAIDGFDGDAGEITLNLEKKNPVGSTNISGIEFYYNLDNSSLDGVIDDCEFTVLVYAEDPFMIKSMLLTTANGTQINLHNGSCGWIFGVYTLTHQTLTNLFHVGEYTLDIIYTDLSTEQLLITNTIPSTAFPSVLPAISFNSSLELGYMDPKIENIITMGAIPASFPAGVTGEISVEILDYWKSQTMDPLGDSLVIPANTIPEGCNGEISVYYDLYSDTFSQNGLVVSFSCSSYQTRSIYTCDIHGSLADFSIEQWDVNKLSSDQTGIKRIQFNSSFGVLLEPVSSVTNIPCKIILSSDMEFDFEDLVIFEDTFENSWVKMSDSQIFDNGGLMIPEQTASGLYYVGLILDPQELYNDPDRSNNISWAADPIIIGSLITDDDNDGLSDSWEILHFGNLLQDANDNPDGDPQSNGEEYITGTDPLDSSDYFYIISTTNALNGFSLYFNSVTNRKYQLFTTTNLTENSWVPVLPIRSGVGALDSMSDTNAIPAHKFYQIKVSLP